MVITSHTRPLIHIAYQVAAWACTSFKIEHCFMFLLSCITYEGANGPFEKLVLQACWRPHQPCKFPRRLFSVGSGANRHFLLHDVSGYDKPIDPRTFPAIGIHDLQSYGGAHGPAYVHFDLSASCDLAPFHLHNTASLTLVHLLHWRHWWHSCAGDCGGTRCRTVLWLHRPHYPDQSYCCGLWREAFLQSY